MLISITTYQNSDTAKSRLSRKEYFERLYKNVFDLTPLDDNTLIALNPEHRDLYDCHLYYAGIGLTPGTNYYGHILGYFDYQDEDTPEDEGCYRFEFYINSPDDPSNCAPKRPYEITKLHNCAFKGEHIDGRMEYYTNVRPTDFGITEKERKMLDTLRENLFRYCQDHQLYQKSKANINLSE